MSQTEFSPAPDGARVLRLADRAPKTGTRRAFVANCPAEHERRLLLAARLAEVMRGNSYARLAARTGWSAETLRRYVKGLASPPATFLMVLVDELSANPEYLLLGRGPVFLDSSLAEPRPVPTRQIVDALHYLLAQQQEDLARARCPNEPAPSAAGRRAT